VKVLFDHNVPKRLRRSLPEHEVRTAREMGWSELTNGVLLDTAQAAGFQVMVTGDKNLSYQQNLQGRELALVVLSTNDWNIIKEKSGPVISAVNLAKPGSFQTVMFENRPPRKSGPTPDL